jgi:hypothetical protein
VMTDEQLIEELSFPVYRRVSTMIFAPGQSPHGASVEMLTIDPRDLQDAQDRDNAMAPVQRVQVSARGLGEEHALMTEKAIGNTASRGRIESPPAPAEEHLYPGAEIHWIDYRHANVAEMAVDVSRRNV